jgi:hypothetical protein
MPLFIPIVLGAVALAGIGLGTKKGYDGVSSIKKATRIAETAQARYDEKKALLEKARESVNVDADTFGTFKLEVARDTLGDMVRLLDELKRRGKISSFDTLEGVDFPTGELVASMREISNTATSVLAGVVVGAVKGSLTGAAVYGLAGSVGVASTGAAISGLAGAAAQSATLAWLGGGALAVGGFGMLGGMVVLGGLVAAPVFLITGFKLAAKGEEALTEALRFESDVDVAVQQMRSMDEAMQQICARMRELTEVISSLRARASARLAALWEMVDRYDEHDQTHSSMLATTMILCRGLSDLLKAPVIEMDGAPNLALPNLIASHRTLNP